MEKKKLKLLACALVIGFTAGLANADIESDLIAHWEFEEGTGTTVSDSANNNVGEFAGAGTTWETGHGEGTALQFSGIGYVAITMDETITPGMEDLTELTISAWVCLSEDNSGWGTIGFKGDLGYGICLHSDKRTFYYVHKSWKEPGDPLTSSTVMDPGVWYHVAGTFNGTKDCLYVNGILEASQDITIPVSNNPGEPFWIGNTKDYPNSYLKDGKVDDLRIYNRGLTAEEVMELMIGDPDFNFPPDINAGNYQSVLWQAPSVMVQLDATVSDDGRPYQDPPADPCTPVGLTLTWSKVSGPGTVTFSPGNDIEDPTATFTAAGLYELQLRGYDGEKDACDVVTIWVRTDSDPIAHWAFEEGAGTTVGDSSANNNVGTFGHGEDGFDPNWVGTGWVGSDSLEFYVSSYVDIATDATQDPNLDNLELEITVAAWFKSTDYQNWETIASKAGTSSWRLRRNGSSSNLNFSISGVGSVNGTRTIDDGYWHHVAGVYNGSTISIYMDGVLDNSAPASGLIPTGSNLVWIGGRSNSPSTRGWKGLLDDVYVYSYGLNADQVEVLAAMAPRIPVVSAGDDQTISIQVGSVQLDGALLADDGDPQAATLEWTSDPCNPGPVTFSPSADIEKPSATFTVAGTYVLRLTADDTVATVYDEVTIIVTDPTCQDVINDGLLATGDISGPEGTPDCRVDLHDFAAMAGNWLFCNDPQDPACESPY